MKRDIKTLREDIARSITGMTSVTGNTQLWITKYGISSIEKILKEIIRLEELEKDIEKLTGLTLEEIKEEARNGGIVPKQEEVDQAYKAGYETGKDHATKNRLPVIPQYMADFIRARKGTDAYSLSYILSLSLSRDEMEPFTLAYDWISENDEMFASAWLAYPNVEVEEGKKYRVRLGDLYVSNYNLGQKDACIVADIKSSFVFKEEEKELADKVAFLVNGVVEEVEE